jgi:hypothetical protein
MPRFAILEHDHPIQHWDFLLEIGDVLRAWRLLAEPRRGQAIRAEAIPDHRRLYLDYEGGITGDRGRVVRWDGGSFTWASADSTEPRVCLSGNRLEGQVAIRRDENGWIWEWS